MIKIKGKILTVTGKHEKLLKRYAKEAKMTPKNFLLAMLRQIEENYKQFGDDIFIERIK